MVNESFWNFKTILARRNIILVILLHIVLGLLFYAKIFTFQPNYISLKHGHDEFSCYPNASHTNIIAYSIYGTNPYYWRGLPDILKNIELYYSGYCVYIFADNQSASEVEKLKGNSNCVKVCHVSGIKIDGYPLASFVPTTWRFFLMGNENVDVILFRDSDAEILKRESDAVHEWLEESIATLHIMRDHPFHFPVILAGMFGLRQNEINRDRIKLVRDQIFSSTIERSDKSFDQKYLTKFLIPSLSDQIFSHDSYHCMKFKNTHPWPTKRNHTFFVGNQTYRPNKFNAVDRPCPKECRPKNHQNWEFC